MAPSTIGFSANGRVFAVGSDTGEIRVWETGFDASGVPFDVSGSLSPVADVLLKSRGSALAISPDGEIIAVGTGGGSIAFWHWRSGEITHINNAHAPGVRKAQVYLETIHVLIDKDITACGVQALAFSPDGEHLASGSINGEIKIWAYKSGRLVIDSKLHAQAISVIGYSPDGRNLAVAAEDGQLSLLNTARGSRLTLKRNEEKIVSVAFSHNGIMLACGSESGTIQIYRVL